MSVDTVRYCEREGILPEPDRDAGGRRVYPESILDAFTLINALRAVGFGVAEVRALTALKQQPEIADRLTGVLERCDAMDAALAARRRELDAAQSLVHRLRAEAIELLL